MSRANVPLSDFLHAFFSNSTVASDTETAIFQAAAALLEEHGPAGLTTRAVCAAAGITAPTLITVGDCDMVRLDHAVRFLQLRGGDVNGDFVGVPASHLAVFPGSTHFNGMARSGLVIDVVTTFLDAESTSTPSMMG
jgi:hypothetical protein